MSDNRRVRQRLDQVVSAGGTTVWFSSAGAGRPLVYVMGWLTHLRLGWEPAPERAFYEALARYQRACSRAATARALLALSYELDVTDRLAQVRAPTLVVHRTGDRAAPVAQADALAAGIDGARLARLPGRSHLPYPGDTGDLVRVIRRFLGLPVARRRADGLTARQRDVADLVSQGCTNREIATRLGIERSRLDAEGFASGPWLARRSRVTDPDPGRVVGVVVDLPHVVAGRDARWPATQRVELFPWSSMRDCDSLSRAARCRSGREGI